MKIQSNVFFISVMILALITSPLSFSGFAFAQEESVELEGTIDNLAFDVPLTNGTFTLNGGDTIVFNAETEFDGLVISELVDGLEVDVDAVLIDGVLFATEIDLAEEDEEEGSFGDKTTICHIPPGNPGKAHTITVGNPAVAAHLAHGDVLDPCTPGQQVSNFVHESRLLFEEQEKETKDVIAQCRVNMQNAEPSERKSVREDCKSNLKDIRESYKSLRETYRETYKAFREDMKVFVQESKGLHIDDSTRDAAIANIESLSDSAENTELQQKISEEITVNKHELRKQMKKDREMARDVMKDKREADRKMMKIERETLRDAGIKSQDNDLEDDESKDTAEDVTEADRVDAKEQREADRVDAKEQREADRVDAKEQREADREAEKSQREAEREATNP